MNKNHKEIFIHHNIKHLRSESNLGQDEFAGLFNVSRDVIGTYERGKAIPKLETMQAICEYFKISLDDFVNRRLDQIQNKPQAGYVNALQEPAAMGSQEVLLNALADKDKLIRMLEAEVKRLKGDQNYNNKTA